jgi:toxin-antitoxin system PIN domain toxin
MIIPDVNVLIHAVNADSPHNERIRNWLDRCLSGDTPLFFPWVVLLGFLRITTNPRIFESPLTLDEAFEYINGWLSHPAVRMISPRKGHWELMRTLLEKIGTAGNLTTDAHLAALAIQWDCVLYSTDTDFARFEGLKWKRP